MRSKFDHQLLELNNDLIVMGSLCEDIIKKSLHSIIDTDALVMNEIIKTNQQIEQLEREIEGRCLKLLLRQQPVAKDLLNISAALKMVYDLKRIGAQSTEIADIVSQNHIQTSEDLRSIRHMSTDVIAMVTDSIDAFVNQDADLAHQVIEKDSQVDREFDRMKAVLIEYFSQKVSDGEHAIDLLMIAKYIERIGDHAVNVAKWVLFSLTGEFYGGET
ncbi:phosphate signaling complex protein PhoU [Atopobacter phocae]|uniref:phosphate signaling complex protein PhoU n=1 Tax=Atopobacter phocae TaxID=136492 RepID=UPI00046F09A2|nr:phosphate signaling complex protein PhoU [Atopobacter phocae]